MSNDLDGFVAAHKLSSILPIDPWTSRDTRAVKSLTTLQVRRMTARADAISDPALKERLASAIAAFAGAVGDLDEKFPNMTVAGFLDWAVIRLQENERTRSVPLSVEMLDLLNEEREAIRTILQDATAIGEDVLDFVVFYDDEKDGFVRRFNDAVAVYNKSISAGATSVARESTELTSGFAHLVWGILSFAVLGLIVYQLLSGQEWVSVNMGGSLAAFLVVWLLSELVRVPADRHYTRKVFARWRRSSLEVPGAVSAEGESTSDLYRRGAIRVLGSLNGEKVRHEIGERGRVSRKTLRQIARDENGPLVDAPALFARQHEVASIPRLRIDVNVEGFFAWARARMGSIVETEARTLNGEINALLGEELRKMNSVLTRGDSATPSDVGLFVAWYNEPAGGYVERFNGAVRAYNQGIGKAVSAVRLRSTAAAAVAALAGVVALVYLSLRAEFTQTLMNATSDLGSATVSVMRDVVIWFFAAAVAFIGWRAWSLMRQWSMRCAHVNWNRRHPDYMLVLPPVSVHQAAAPAPSSRFAQGTRRREYPCATSTLALSVIARSPSVSARWPGLRPPPDGPRQPCPHDAFEYLICVLALSPQSARARWWSSGPTDPLADLGSVGRGRI